ncbi:hypothetical protein CDD80_2782 [Ophiocordyceps camponoti-rufipedis]|uniref:Uncharacterized protein n=1 Tax=Ophiocordyceps camponoti-rufipedis TaxID=2004952 RepID=A0A2C5Z4V4_9HYPO|nr:hypothetical protein CDD80_2782 [Ophiocordyceps camponoti-rufipedis]
MPLPSNFNDARSVLLEYFLVPTDYDKHTSYLLIHESIGGAQPEPAAARSRRRRFGARSSMLRVERLSGASLQSTVYNLYLQSPGINLSDMESRSTPGPRSRHGPDDEHSGMADDATDIG